MGGSAVSAVALSNHQLLRRGIRYQSRKLKVIIYSRSIADQAPSGGHIKFLY